VCDISQIYGTGITDYKHRNVRVWRGLHCHYFLADCREKSVNQLENGKGNKYLDITSLLFIRDK